MTTGIMLILTIHNLHVILKYGIFNVVTFLTYIGGKYHFMILFLTTCVFVINNN